MGIFDHSSRSTFVRSPTDVGWEGLTLSIHSNSSQRCSVQTNFGMQCSQTSIVLWMQLLSHANPFHEVLYTLLELIWRPHEVWRSVVIDSAESWRPLLTKRLSICWPRSVILRGLPLHGWVAVVPNRFHFVIIPLTVDCGIFRSKEISRLDLLHRWHPITVPHWNSQSSLNFIFVQIIFHNKYSNTCGKERCN